MRTATKTLDGWLVFDRRDESRDQREQAGYHEDGAKAKAIQTRRARQRGEDDIPRSVMEKQHARTSCGVHTKNSSSSLKQ